MKGTTGGSHLFEPPAHNAANLKVRSDYSESLIIYLSSICLDITSRIRFVTKVRMDINGAGGGGGWKNSVLTESMKGFSRFQCPWKWKDVAQQLLLKGEGGKKKGKRTYIYQRKGIFNDRPSF